MDFRLRDFLVFTSANSSILSRLGLTMSYGRKDSSTQPINSNQINLTISLDCNENHSNRLLLSQHFVRCSNGWLWNFEKTSENFIFENPVATNKIFIAYILQKKMGIYATMHEKKKHKLSLYFILSSSFKKPAHAFATREH